MHRAFRLSSAKYVQHMRQVRWKTTNSSPSAEFEEIFERSTHMRSNRNDSVFYNKVQVLNRDLSVLVINHFAKVREEEKLKKFETAKAQYSMSPAGYHSEPKPLPEGITLLDAMAASGIRSMRYAQEVSHVRHITVNDIDLTAINSAKSLLDINPNVDREKITFNQGDAVDVMYSHRHPLKQFDVIDLDPYGTCAPFIDAAVQAISPGGLLAITSTDLRALCAITPETCFSQYGSMPIMRSPFCHETALRILIHAVDTCANKYKKHVVPWLSINVDFYVRCYLRVMDSPLEVSRSATRRCMVAQSLGCPSFYVQPMGHEKTPRPTPQTAGKPPMFQVRPSTSVIPQVCEETGYPLKLCGPFWSAPLHDMAVVKGLLDDLTAMTSSESALPPFQSLARAKSLLTCVASELPDVPFYYDIGELFSAVGTNVAQHTLFMSAIVNAGYRVSQFHREPRAIKTDAPNKLIWDIVRSFVKRNARSTKKHQPVALSASSQSKEAVQETGKEAGKEVVKETGKETVKEARKEGGKEGGKEVGKEEVQEEVKEAMEGEDVDVGHENREEDVPAVGVEEGAPVEQTKAKTMSHNATISQLIMSQRITKNISFKINEEVLSRPKGLFQHMSTPAQWGPKKMAAREKKQL